MRILVVMDPPERIHPEGDTTVVVIEEALRRGHVVEICASSSLSLDADGVPAAQVRIVTATSTTSRPAITVGDSRRCRLDECAAVLMRTDPPFDLDYFFATQLLERARGKTLLVNDPRGLRDANEKLYIFNFPSWIVPTIVSRSLPELRAFLATQGGEMIVKPLDGAGGSGIFHVRSEDRNTNAILEVSTDGGRRWCMAQQYLPQAREGDKRILLLDGEPIGAVLRVPRGDDTRGNLHVGGTAKKAPLSDRERALCAEVGARCRADGLYFVGIDVIGERLTEVNVTSPTGMQEIDRLEGHVGSARMPAVMVDWLERRAIAH